MVHMPEVETWSVADYPPPTVATPVKRVGLNLGAPGNRFADTGTLWLETPSVAGPSPDVPVWVEGTDAMRWFRRHSYLATGELNWVAASGVEGVRTVTVRPFLQPVEPPAEENLLEPPAEEDPPRQAQAFKKNRRTPAAWERDQVVGRFDQPAGYKVRLWFAEPNAAMAVGGRVFSVSLQGRCVLEKFDILEAAGQANRSVVKEFDVEITDDLSISLTSISGEPVLCGIELLAR